METVFSFTQEDVEFIKNNYSHDTATIPNVLLKYLVKHGKALEILPKPKQDILVIFSITSPDEGPFRTIRYGCVGDMNDPIKPLPQSTGIITYKCVEETIHFSGNMALTCASVYIVAFPDSGFDSINYPFEIAVEAEIFLR